MINWKTQILELDEGGRTEGTVLSHDSRATNPLDCFRSPFFQVSTSKYYWEFGFGRSRPHIVGMWKSLALPEKGKLFEQENNFFYGTQSGDTKTKRSVK